MQFPWKILTFHLATDQLVAISSHPLFVPCCVFCIPIQIGSLTEKHAFFVLNLAMQVIIFCIPDGVFAELPWEKNKLWLFVKQHPFSRTQLERIKLATKELEKKSTDSFQKGHSLCNSLIFPVREEGKFDKNC